MGNDLIRKANTMKYLSKNFDLVWNPDKKTRFKKNFGVLDTVCVCMFIPKTEFMRDILREFTNKDGRHEIPELNYKSSDENITSKYSLEYLEKIIKLFKVIDTDDENSLSFSMKKDHPITIENEELKVILAPRVDNE